jgi:hypothetical protein
MVIVKHNYQFPKSYAASFYVFVRSVRRLKAALPINFCLKEIEVFINYHNILVIIEIGYDISWILVKQEVTESIAEC